MKAQHVLHMVSYFSNDREQRFRALLWGILTLYMFLGITIGLLEVKTPPFADIKKLPPRIVKLIIPPKVEAPPKPAAKPKEVPPVQEDKPKEVPKEEPEVASLPEPLPEELAEEQRRQDIEVAMNSGLLSLLKQSESGSVSEEKLQKTFSNIKSLSSHPDSSKTGLALTEGSQPSGGIDDIVSQLERTLQDSKVVISDKAMRGSGGINTQEMGSMTELALQERETTAIENPFEIKGYAEGKSPRTYESIAEVVERYKNGIGILYSKALRKNPALRGTVTVEFTIAASGDVLDCKAVSSSMEEPPFEEALCRRILQWKFPSILEGDVTVSYPLVFYVTG